MCVRFWALLEAVMDANRTARQLYQIRTELPTGLWDGHARSIYLRTKYRGPVGESQMNDRRNGHGNGHGNGYRVVEDHEHKIFSVNREVFVSPVFRGGEPGHLRQVLGLRRSRLGDPQSWRLPHALGRRPADHLRARPPGHTRTR